MGEVPTLNWFQFSDHRNKAVLTDGWWGETSVSGGQEARFLHNYGKQFQNIQRKKGSKIHPILNMNRPSPSLPAAVSTSRSWNVWGERLEQGERGGREALAETYAPECRDTYPQEIKEKGKREKEKRILCLKNSHEPEPDNYLYKEVMNQVRGHVNERLQRS